MFGIRRNKDSPEYENGMQKSLKTFLEFTYSTVNVFGIGLDHGNTEQPVEMLTQGQQRCSALFSCNAVLNNIVMARITMF